MRVGFVTYWFNGGQATIGRYLRATCAGLGHETFVLARPTKPEFVRSAFVAGDDVWAQPGVERASAFDIPAAEYDAWAERNRLDAVWFLQNYQFDEIAALRRRGVRTFGWFAWEAFLPRHVAGTLAAFDAVVAFMGCEVPHYRALGIGCEYVPWGVHPELLDVVPQAGDDRDHTVRMLYPGGYLSHRKPTQAVLRALARVDAPELRLVLKAQGVQKQSEPFDDFVRADPRIEVVLDDLPTAAYHSFFASCDVCVAPSRWEGLGLHLYQALGFGVPVLTNDAPPMNEVVEHGRNGWLVPSVVTGTRAAGVPVHEPDEDALVGVFDALRDPALRARLRNGALDARARWSWDRTTVALDALLRRVAAP